MRDVNALKELTGIDPNRPGKHRSKITIPIDRGRTVELAITLVRRGPGPLILFTAGNHGDEYEGPAALLKLTHDLRPADLVRGGVIVMPIINPPAVDAGTRTSPIDGKNLNRVFPGRKSGSVTERIAYLITTAVLPHAIALLDLHAGGRTTSVVPSIMGHTFKDARRTRDTVEMMRAFRAPMGILIKEYETKGMIDTTAGGEDGAAFRMLRAWGRRHADAGDCGRSRDGCTQHHEAFRPDARQPGDGRLDGQEAQPPLRR